tara:strand:- start:201 stop:392 length:192 start_codon:yes stop_codon:yes gene_type:complete
MDEEEKKILSTGLQVAQLKRGEAVIYLNPVASERAKIMIKEFHYSPQVYNKFTLKPNRYYAKN